MPQRVSRPSTIIAGMRATTFSRRSKSLVKLLIGGASLLAISVPVSGQGTFGAGGAGLASTVFLNQATNEVGSGSAAQLSSSTVILPVFGNDGSLAQPQDRSAVTDQAANASSLVLPVPSAAAQMPNQPKVPSQRPLSIFIGQAEASTDAGHSNPTMLPVPAALPLSNQSTNLNVVLGDAVVADNQSSADANNVTLPVPGSSASRPMSYNAELGGRSTENYQALVTRYGGDGAAADLVPMSSPLDGPAGMDIASLLTETIDRDSRIQGLGFRLSTSDADADALRAGWVPRLETGFRSDYNVSTGTSNALTFGARQRVFDFGRTDAALQTVTAQRILSGARMDEMRFTIATEFLSAYLNAMSATRGIAADAEEIATLEQAVAANQRLADSGATSLIAARESQVDLNAARARQTERGLSLLQANQQLISLTRGRFANVSKPAFETFVTRHLPSNVEVCVARGLAGDSQLAVIDARIEEAAAQLTERQLSRLPSIDIVGQTGLRPFSGTSDLGMRSQTGINFAINGDLFDGGVNEAEVRAQRLAIRELQRERETIKRELELDIRRSYAAVKATGDLLVNQRSSLAVLADLVSARQRQADGGIGLVQDVLTAKVRLVQAENALTDIETDFDRERTRLVLLCGNRF